MCQWNLKKKFLIVGIFLKIGGNGANMLVEFEKKILTGGIFFFKIGGIFFKLGAMLINCNISCFVVE